jgi:hypothetical protein
MAALKCIVCGALKNWSWQIVDGRCADCIGKVRCAECGEAFDEEELLHNENADGDVCDECDTEINNAVALRNEKRQIEINSYDISDYLDSIDEGDDEDLL